MNIFTINNEIDRHVNALVQRAVDESITIQDLINLLLTACGDDATGGESWLIDRGDVEDLADKWITHLAKVYPADAVTSGIAECIENYGVRAFVDWYARRAITLEVNTTISNNLLSLVETQLPPDIPYQAIVIKPHETMRGVWINQRLIGLAWPAEEKTAWTIQDFPLKKTAANLAAVRLETDPYHTAIVRAAHRLCDEGRGSWFYVTQFGSGTTTWKHPSSSDTCIIKGEDQ
jgi:hypothetical protein